MKVLALYVEKTLPILRRVLAPFSTLSKRSYDFSFQQVTSFHVGISASYDVTILQNWIMTRAELDDLATASLEQQRVYVYDCSDPTLLEEPVVQEAMRYCRLVTVPNERMQKETKILVPGIAVKVVPSCLDVQYLVTGRSYPRPKEVNIGCFGPFDWSLLVDALKEVKTLYPHVQFLSDRQSVTVLGTDLTTPVEVNADNYPGVIHGSLGALLPLEKDQGQDWRICQHEWGLLERPTLVFYGVQPLAQQVERIRSLIVGRWDTSLLVERALQQKNTLLASEYRRVYDRMLPHLL